jgi:hypothetical protein
VLGSGDELERRRERIRAESNNQIATIVHLPPNNLHDYYAKGRQTGKF